MSPLLDTSLTEEIAFPEKLNNEDAATLNEHVSREGRVQRELFFQGVLVPVGSRLLQVGALRMDSRAQLERQLWFANLPFEVAMKYPSGGEVVLMLIDERTRSFLRSHLSTKLVIDAKTALAFPDRNCGAVRVEVGSIVVRAATFRRDSFQQLQDALLTSSNDLLEVKLSKGIDTQVVEQSWHLLNRYKRTLRRTGPSMYTFLLHLWGHLMNRRKWLIEEL